MSEQGNRSFKPSVSSQAMRLVHAAKYDTATMMYQEKEIGSVIWLKHLGVDCQQAHV